MSSQLNATSRVVIPGSNASVGPGGLAVYRVPSTLSGNPQSQRASLVSAPPNNSGTVSELTGPGIRLITPANTPSSLIRVQASTFAQPVHPLLHNPTSNSSTNGNIAFCSA